MNNASSKQVLIISYNTFPESLHPHLVSDIRSQTICKSLYEGLTRVALDGKPKLAAAEKVEISPCNKKYTFTLRNTLWSNGEKITSHHFANAWISAISSKSNCNYTKRLFLIKNAKKAYNNILPLKEVGISTPSDHQLIVELEHPAPYFLELVADPVYSPIYSSDIDKDPTVFNGPFIVEHYDLNKKMTLYPNSQYWDAKAVKLKRIEINFIKDMQTAFSEYEKQETSWIGSPFINLPDEIISHFPNLKHKQASAPFWVFCNTKAPKLRSHKIRQALSYAIDREELIKYVIPKQKETLYNILPKDISSLSSDNPLDIKKALDLFKEGLKDLNMNQKDFYLTLNHSSSSDQEKIALYLKDLWEKVFGIKITLRKDDWNAFYSKIKSGNYEIGGLFVCNLYDDPSYLMESFEFSHSNYSGWENPNYQKYFSLANQSEDPNKRKSYLKKAEEILVEEMPVIPIYNHAHLYLCNEKLMNFSAPKFNYADFKWAYFDDEL